MSTKCSKPPRILDRGCNDLRARIPLDQIEALAADPDVKPIRPADRAIINKNDTSEGDVAHRADLARATFGVDGTGVKIGVLSDGVDTLAARQATGDLPVTVTVLSGQAGSGDEGTAMLEIVHDLAPGAELCFATAFTGQASFAQNILDLNAAGCDVIVDDIFYFAEGVFQDDNIAQSVNTVTATDPSAGGAVYFSSAGNAGNLNDGTSGVWEGDFVPITPPPPLVGAGNAHDFGAGINANTITEDPPFAITLQWSDPLGGSGNDYDLFLLNPAGTAVLDSSINFQDGDDDPYEFIDSGPFNDATNLLVIIQFSGAARFLHLNTIRGELAISTDGQTSGHACAEEGFGVAAVDAAGITTPFEGSESVQTYSSDGPRKIFYDADGTAITPGDFSSTGGTTRQKPDITAADCVDTDTPGFSPFCGTSAAAPHAAAIAALLLGCDSDLMQAEIRTALTNTALDIEETSIDRDSGAGIITTFNALNSLSTGTVTLVNQNPVLTWRYRLTHNDGKIGSWVYRGAFITDARVTSAAAAVGWAVESQTPTQVVFTTTAALTTGSRTGFHISGTVAGTGAWSAGGQSGNIDGAMPVELSLFTGTRTEDGTLISWRTQTETRNLGFHLYRREAGNQAYIRITPTLIKGYGTDATPHDYSFLDDTAEDGKAYWYLIEDIDLSGITNQSHPIFLDPQAQTFLSGRIHATSLYQNYPNPFNPETWIPYNLAAKADISIVIYNAAGVKIQTLSLGAKAPGTYLEKNRAAYWNGRDDQGENVSSGLYFYEFVADDFQQTKRMILLK